MNKTYKIFLLFIVLSSSFAHAWFLDRLSGFADTVAKTCVNNSKKIAFGLGATAGGIIYLSIRNKEFEFHKYLEDKLQIQNEEGVFSKIEANDAYKSGKMPHEKDVRDIELNVQLDNYNAQVAIIESKKCLEKIEQARREIQIIRNNILSIIRERQLIKHRVPLFITNVISAGIMAIVVQRIGAYFYAR